eukprot:1588412-Rhodomonas_salina.1
MMHADHVCVRQVLGVDEAGWVMEGEEMAVKLRVSHSHLLLVLDRPQPNSRTRKIPAQENALNESIVLGAICHKRVFTWKKACAIAAPDLNIPFVVLTEIVTCQVIPRRQSICHHPMIVHPTEVLKRPLPEASRRVGCLQKTAHVFFGNTDSTFDVRLRGVIVSSCRADGDALGLTVSLKP